MANAIGRKVLEGGGGAIDIWDTITADHAASIMKKGLTRALGWAESLGNFAATAIGLVFI